MAGLILLALCLVLALPSALAETREGVIYLEGMEETIEETLFESPEGFSFWYASEGLEARPGTAEDPEGATVSNIYSDDYMALSMISEEEAVKCTADLDVNIREQAAAGRVQVDVYQKLEDGRIHFLTLIGDQGKYLRAEGAYALEAADGIFKYFLRILDSVTLIHPDAFLGRFADGGNNEVTVAKQEDGYAMSVSLYRLTALDEGTVSFLGEKLIFHTLDAAENPMTLSFYPVGPDQFALRVEESTWEYLEAGTVFDGLEKQAD